MLARRNIGGCSVVIVQTVRFEVRTGRSECAALRCGTTGGKQVKRLTLILTMILAAGFAHAQSAAAPAPTGLVVGSGNYFSPIVADLEKAIAFYGAIGFQFQGEPSTADANPQLRAMFGLPDARLRYQIGRAPSIHRARRGERGKTLSRCARVSRTRPRGTIRWRRGRPGRARVERRAVPRRPAPGADVGLAVHVDRLQGC